MKSALAFVILILSGFSAFATVYHSDGSAVNVQLIHDIQAIDGDTITLPSGTFSWTTGVNVTKAITIQGNTTVNSDTGVCNDLTTIVDNVPRPNGRIFRCTNTSSTQVVRITGITFTGVGGATNQNFNGMITFGGGGIKNRIDHCHFTGHLAELNFFAVYGSASGPTYGVADHLVMDGFQGSQTGQQQIKSGTSQYGDSEWTQSMGYGGPNFFFIEDCYLNNSDGVNNVGGGVDSGSGGKYVVRHCHLYNVELLNHGTDSSGRNRGGKGYELYNNDYHWGYLTTMDGIRSGSMIAHDNTFAGVKPHGYSLQTYRTFYSFDPWGGASGDNPWDLNDPVLYDSGTTTGGSDHSITDTSKNWTTNQWVGFVFKRLSDGQIGKVVSNDNHTAIVYVAGYSYSWSSGQAYEIHRIPYVTLDQVCRGRGDLITGDTPINSTTGTPAWPHQDIEPCYSWNNVFTPDGSTIDWSIESNPPLQEGRDYFSDTPMPGYTPYTYPHPLVTGGSPTPTPTPSSTPSATATTTATSTPSPTLTPTATPTATVTPNPTPTATVPPTPTPLPSPTPTPTPTAIPTATPTATPTSTLVAAYAFNEGSGTVVNDASGNGNNGTISDATWTTSGEYGNALTFNGTSALVTINNTASLQLTTGMTLEAWVYPTTVYSAWQDVIYKGDDNYYLSGTSPHSSSPLIGAIFNGVRGEVYGPTALTANTWAHLAATYDGTTLRLYVNAVQVASQTQTGTIAASTNPLQIGGDNIYGQYFAGRIDEVRIYNGALSVAEIENDMNTPVAPPPIPTPTPTATPTLNRCEVPNFIGTRLNHAQRLWNDAGFTTQVIILPGPDNQIDYYHYITWQSLPEGFIGSCSDTTISVE